MIVRSMLAAVAVLGLSGFALAQTEGESKEKGSCCSGAAKTQPGACCESPAKAQTVADKGATSGCTAGKESCAADKASCSGDKLACSGKSGCDLETLAKAGLKVPAMSFKVGDKATQCPMEAAKLAKADSASIRFVVADKTFDDEAEAKKAHAAQLDSFLNEVVAVRYAVGEECTSCPMTAESLAKKAGAKVRFRVAAYDFESKEVAEQAVAKARKAAEGVHLTMRVGEKTYECPVTAGDVAKSEGKPVEYCVGEKASPCKVSASVDLARARIEAAVAALAEAAKG